MIIEMASFTSTQSMRRLQIASSLIPSAKIDPLDKIILWHHSTAVSPSLQKTDENYIYDVICNHDYRCDLHDDQGRSGDNHLKHYVKYVVEGGELEFLVEFVI